MTDAEQEDEPAGRGLRRYLIDGVVALVGIVAVTGGVLASVSGEADRPSPPKTTTPEVVALPPALATSGAYAPELGPAGRRWVWLRDRGTFISSDPLPQRPYVAFRAHSLRTPRTLTVGGTAVKLSAVPRTYVVRPNDAGTKRIALRVSPGPARISTTDRRRVSAFVGAGLAAPTPGFALPGDGFYPQERDARGPFYWMANEGTLDLVTAAPARSQGKVRLVVWSPTVRTVVIRRASGKEPEVRALIAAQQDTEIKVDRVALSGGRAQLTLETKGAARTGRDPRRLALQLRSAQLIT